MACTAWESALGSSSSTCTRFSANLVHLIRHDGSPPPSTADGVITGQTLHDLPGQQNRARMARLAVLRNRALPRAPVRL